MEDMITKIT